MKRYSTGFRVYRNGKSKAVLPTETEAFEYLKSAVTRHKKAEFIIERMEIVFDSHGKAEDMKKLNEMRTPRRDNAIHASIHEFDRDIGRE